MGVAVGVTRSDYTADDLRYHASKSVDGAQVRRLLALASILEGRCRGEAAAHSGMDRQSLCDWVHRYNAAGIAGLKSHRSPGRAPALSTAQMAELRALVVAGPDPAEHKVVRWRCVERLTMPNNVTLLRLPPYSPELNPIENVWEYLRGNKLSTRVWHGYEDIVEACCDARNWLIADTARVSSVTTR